MFKQQLPVDLGTLIAEAAGPTWGLGHILTMIVVVAACIVIALLALKNYGITVPPIVAQVFWIVVVAVVAIFAIKFLLTL